MTHSLFISIRGRMKRITPKMRQVEEDLRAFVGERSRVSGSSSFGERAMAAVHERSPMQAKPAWWTYA